jgi:transcriptional regulator with XRE-family HTH domain
VKIEKKKMNKTFRQFLEDSFLKWQIDKGGRKTVYEFAEYLGVSQPAVSAWWNETRIPQGDTIRKLAEKLGVEVYDVLGLPRPDPDLFYIQSVWDELTPETRKALRERVEGYATKNEQQQNRPKPKRALRHS